MTKQEAIEEVRAFMRLARLDRYNAPLFEAFETLIEHAGREKRTCKKLGILNFLARDNSKCNCRNRREL